LTEAIEQFEKAVECSSRFAPGHYMLGETFRKLGRFSEAISAYNELLRLNPKDVDAWVRLGECNLQLDFLDAAREAIGRALVINPEHREAQYLSKHLGEIQTPHKPGF
jgi:tetratricopeptide (TPR) repeat protein